MKCKTLVALGAAALCSINVVADDEDPFALFKRVKADWAVAKTNETVYQEYMTDDLWIDYANQVCATNAVLNVAGKSDNSLLVNPYVIRSIVNYQGHVPAEERPAYFEAWDSKLVDSGFSHAWWPNWFPKCFAAFRQKNPQFEVNQPVMVALAATHQYEPSLAPTGMEKINILLEDFSRGGILQDKITERVKDCAKFMTVPVKRYLRSHGKTFVIGPNGENPVQDVIDEFIAAIESPKAAGVKEWVAKIDPTYEWIDIKVVSDDDYRALQDAVFFGEKPLNNASAVILQYFLGTEGYNAFIEQYNSDANAQ